MRKPEETTAKTSDVSPAPVTGPRKAYRRPEVRTLPLFERMALACEDKGIPDES